MNPPPDDEPLIGQLLRLREDRGLTAHLRKYWSPTSRLSYAVPVLGRLRIIGKLPDEITAALFAEHCRQSLLHQPGGPTLGRACLRLAGGSPQADGFESFDRHFRRLLACESLDELGNQLARIVKRLQRDGIPLDYNRLLWDLRDWPDASDQVKTHWAMDFYQAPAELVDAVTP